MSQSPEKKISDLEKMLAALAPRPAQLDRDRLLFRAGQQSMRSRWRWPLVATTMSAVSVCLALLLVLRPTSEPVVRIVKVEVPVFLPGPESLGKAPVAYAPGSASASGSSAEPMSYWQMQQQALHFGVEGLPSTVYEGDDKPFLPAGKGQDLSVGSRPNLGISSSLFTFGVP